MPVPTVTSTSPADDAGGTPINAAISAVFSTAMDATTITAATFLLSKGSAVTGVVTYNAGTNTATLTPSAPLVYKGTYTAKLTTGCQATGAIPLAKAYVWKFSVVASGPKPKLHRIRMRSRRGA